MVVDGYVLYNGQLAFTQTEGIYEKYFKAETLREIAKFADEGNRDLVFGGRHRFYGSRSIRLGQKKIMKQLYHYLPQAIKNGDLSRQLDQRAKLPTSKSYYQKLPIFSRPIYQCVLLSPESEQAELEARFPDCTFTRSNPISVDIIPKGTSKIDGIKRICQTLSFDLKNVAAFGDSWNDTQMLSEVGFGIAMGNAPQAVKEVAYATTSSNEDNGIYLALKELGVIR